MGDVSSYIYLLIVGCKMDNTLWQNISKMTFKNNIPFSWEELERLMERRDEDDNRNQLVPDANN